MNVSNLNIIKESLHGLLSPLNFNSNNFSTGSEIRNIAHCYQECVLIGQFIST